MGEGSGHETAATWVATVAWIRSLAQQLPYTTDAAEKKKKKRKKNLSIYVTSIEQNITQ